MLQSRRVRECVERERKLRCALHAEEVHLGAQAEDQIVVGDWLELAELHLPLVEVDLRDDVLMDARVRLVVDEVAQRMPDGRLVEEAGGDLVEERLERVVVVLVDDDHVHVALLQLPCGPDACEAATENEHQRAASG